jgi:Cys-tRNA(Pro)/Cys-tRNA(Cys) deacylase
VPTNAKVDLKRLADIVGARRLQMATKDELDNQLDYPSHGVSPIGASGMQVLMNASLLTHETILIGAGIVGEEIELQPQAVQELANATVVELVQTVQTLG